MPSLSSSLQGCETVQLIAWDYIWQTEKAEKWKSSEENEWKKFIYLFYHAQHSALTTLPKHSRWCPKTTEQEDVELEKNF